MFKWIVLGIVLLVVAALAVMSLLTRETRVSEDPNPELKPCPGTPNCVSSKATDPQFKVEALALIEDDPAKSWQRIREAIDQTGGEILRQDERYLHAVFTSKIFRFKDDLELVLEAGHIDVRSASRAGRSDMGKNRERVEELRRIYLN